MKKIVFILFVGMLGVQSCKEVIATDITETIPNLIMPQLYDTILANPVHFKWDVLDGATEYHMQVVSPSFSNITSYAVDSMVTGTELYLSMDSNQYEMQLTAVNAGYSSHTLGPLRFWVGVQGGSTSNTVVLSSPENAVYFNEDLTGFDNHYSWQNVTDFSSFEFSLRKGSSYASPDEITYTQTSIASLQLDLGSVLNLGEGEYHWGVKAYFNNGTESPVSTRQFFIDTVNPVIPTAATPILNSNVTASTAVAFTWSNASDIGGTRSPVSSYIEVASDNTFTSGLQSRTVNTTTCTFDMNGQTGVRYWRVKNVDEAGNESAWSQIIQFSLVP